MTVKVVLGLLVLVLAVFGFQQLRSNQEIKERIRRGRVPVAIEDAKAQNQREVRLSAPIPYYAEVRSLDEALANYATVVARPVSQFTQINPDRKEIETWYKLEVVDFLSQPKLAKCTDCSFAKSVPTELQPVQANEIVVVRNTGSVVLDGIKVTSSDRMFPDFKMNQKYLFFLSLDLSTRVGLIDLGQAGVSVIESDGEITPISDDNGLNNELKKRFGKIDQIKTQLRFRRFPE
jgi:hypothetical protein